jgi:ferrous iron transport protein B
VFATLAVGVPYIMTFYLMMAVLEDTGYVNAVAYLTDRVMRHFGLQGRAVIPLIAAGGCNVPAIMGARVLTSKRERIIASTLITLVPCSARTAVIVGAVSLYGGWQWAMFVYAVVVAVGVGAGLGLNRLLPGKPGDLVMEMFPLRRPSVWLVVRKTWARLRDFVWVAAPIIIGGSVLLGALYESGLVWHLTRPLSPVVEGWLGLPAVAGLTLLFAVLRKELALQLLVALAVVVYGGAAHNLLHFMTVHQLVVYALVSCLYVPCASTIAVLGRELGWKIAGLISAGTLVVALIVGGAVSHVLPFL